MDAFLLNKPPPPSALFTSKEISDRKSIFVGAIYPATSLKEAKNAIRHHTSVIHRSNKASHEIAAWRVMALKSGRNGTSGPDDFEVSGGSDDDGEKNAGAKMLKVMQRTGAIDAVVIVSRWYGGILLGPVRFTHIEECTEEVCNKFTSHEQSKECIKELETLDVEIQELRASINQNEQGNVKVQSYQHLERSWDSTKGERLVNARKKTIESLRKIISSKAQKINSG